MKQITILLAIAMFMLTGCAIAGQPKPEAAAPQPTVGQQTPTAEQQKTAEQLKKVFEAGVYWGAMSLGELSMTDEYKGKPVPMEIIVKTAWSKMADSQKQAATKGQQPSTKSAAKGAGK